MLVRQLQRFTSDQAGATAIEYALIALLIAVALIATLTVFGNSVTGLFNSPAIGTLEAVNDSM